MSPALKYRKAQDALLNVMLTLTAGACIYLLKQQWVLPAFVKNYLADGFWAYALLNMVLIIWERTINRFWMILVFALPVAFEYGQWTGFIAGTGDPYDVAVCFLFFIISFLLNPYFKHIFNKFHYDQAN